MTFRVLHLMPARPFGGLQRLALGLAGAQRRAGLDARVLGIYDDQASRTHAAAWDVPFRYTEGTRPGFLSAAQLLSALAATSPDCLHVHGGLLWSNLLVALTKRCPIVVHLHTHVGRGCRALACDATARLSADLLIAVTRAVADDYTARFGYRAKPIVVIPNGIPLPAQCRMGRPPRAQASFGMATRLDVSKGVFEFLVAAAAIRERLPNARFTLAGEGDALDALKQSANRMGLASCFSFPGLIDDVAAFWREIDVALFTSPQDAFGFGLVEPLAQGTPVIAFRNGSGSDEVVDCCRGILSCEWDDFATYAELAHRVVTDRSLYERLGREGCHDVRRNFSLEAMEIAVRKVYQELLHLRSAPFGITFLPN